MEKQRLFKPTFLLWLPVVVWAATFFYGTCLLFYLLNTEWDYYNSDYVVGTAAVAIFINIVAVVHTLIMTSVHPFYQKEFGYRLLLLLTNIPVAYVYIYLARAHAPFLN
ncbi:hypothetical protein ACLI09_06660 [Flavobacterium sp. RHBU_24]|uniref:hypothetical protein n=1 Tax=Flavobacterium sp. RHBU_24 TaxID=3391185 RepID=UPI0039849009